MRSISLLGAAATISFALAGQALAQADGSWFPFKIPGLTTGSVTPAAPLPPVAPGSSEWSGESGSSRTSADDPPTPFGRQRANASTNAWKRYGQRRRAAGCRGPCSMSKPPALTARPADHGPA